MKKFLKTIFIGAATLLALSAPVAAIAAPAPNLVAETSSEVILPSEQIIVANEKIEDKTGSPESFFSSAKSAKLASLPDSLKAPALSALVPLNENQVKKIRIERALRKLKNSQVPPKIGGSITVNLTKRSIACSAWGADKGIYFYLNGYEEVYISPYPQSFAQLPLEKRKTKEKKWIQDRMLPVGSPVAGVSCTGVMMGVSGIKIKVEE